MIRLQSIQTNLIDITRKLSDYASGQKIFLLEGAIGAGKTTLIKSLCSTLGALELVSSPTFTLMHEYPTHKHGLIYHFDCYRINHIDEAIALDFENYFTSGHYCFIEWPFKIAPILPAHYFLIKIEIISPTTRNLICNSY